MYCTRILAGLVCLAPGLVYATSVCVPGTLEEYVELGPEGCSVDDLIFTNFQFSATPSFTSAPDPSAILVTPDRTPILGNELVGGGAGSGLNFAFNEVLMPQPNAATREFVTPALSMTLRYDVGSARGLSGVVAAPQLAADPMATATATLTVGSAPCASGDASQGAPGISGCALGGAAGVSVVQDIRLATAPQAGAGAEVKSVATRWAVAAGSGAPRSIPPPQTSDSGAIKPMTWFDPSPMGDRTPALPGMFGVTGGSAAAGDASAPEPGTWMLVGLGLGLAGLWGRRRRAARAQAGR